jgi:hypothetical protein
MRSETSEPGTGRTHLERAMIAASEQLHQFLIAGRLHRSPFAPSSRCIVLPLCSKKVPADLVQTK